MAASADEMSDSIMAAVRMSMELEIAEFMTFDADRDDALNHNEQLKYLMSISEKNHCCDWSRVDLAVFDPP